MNRYGVWMQIAPTLQEGGRYVKNELAENFPKWASMIWLSSCKSRRFTAETRRTQKSSQAAQYLTKQAFEIKYNPHIQAGVAELADALRSGRSELTLMRVQIPPSAHKNRLALRGSIFIYNLKIEEESTVGFYVIQLK